MTKTISIITCDKCGKEVDDKADMFDLTIRSFQELSKDEYDICFDCHTSFRKWFKETSSE